jgi:hypothetical protein
MATQAQYEFFRSLYEEEERTSLQLEGRAKVYLGIISAFLVTVFLKTDEVVRSATTLKISFSLLLIEAVLLSIALVFVILGLRIRHFEAVNDGVDIVNAYGETEPEDSEFFDDRIADYAFASSRNRAFNNETAVLLAWASWLIIAGMLGVLCIAISALWRISHG